MPDVLLAGPSGKLEVRYYQPSRTSPIAFICPGLPQMGGHMNQHLLYSIYHDLLTKGYTVVRFNFRGVGNSTGTFEGGEEEQLDASHVLDYITNKSPGSPGTLIVGHSFGAWVGMQLMARRPDVTAFVSLAPPKNFDYSFLTSDYIRAKGLFISGGRDGVVSPADVQHLSNQCNHELPLTRHVVIDEANHNFDLNITEVVREISGFVSS